MNASEIKKENNLLPDHRETISGILIGLFILFFFWMCMKYA